jgi:tripartite-type tricarboxylate transporter receptor subunit TctC
MLKTPGTFLAALIGLVLAADPAHPSTHEPFYKGKTIRIIVGATPGGGFDTYSRAIARYMGKHIAGNPTVIVENMAGAGTLIAANYTYKAVKPDGLTIGNFIGGLVLGQLLGQPGIEFDARKFEWVGVPSRDNVACAFTKASGITSMEKWMASKTPVKLGATGRGTAPEDTPKVLKAALGLPIHLITGYKGTADIRLAAESGEVAGGCWQWESIKVTWRKALEAGEASVVLQVTPQPLPDLPGVPLAISFAKTEEARTLIQVGVQNQSAITRLYAFPPGTPKERVRIMRKAFQDTLKDPEFVADAKKSKLEIDPTTGEEVERIIAEFFKLDPALIASLKGIL